MQLPPDNALSHHMQHPSMNVKVEHKKHTPKNYLFQSFLFTRLKISAQEHVIGQEGSLWKSLEHLLFTGNCHRENGVLGITF